MQYIYVRLILKILYLRRIFKSARFRPEENYRLEAREFSGVHQHRLVFAEDLVERSHIRRQLAEICGHIYNIHIRRSPV